MSLNRPTKNSNATKLYSYMKSKRPTGLLDFRILLLFVSFITFGQANAQFTLLLTEDFEDDGEGSTYRSNTFDQAVGDLWARLDLTSFPAGPHATGTTSGYNFYSNYSAHEGDYAFGGEDVDANVNPLGSGKPSYVTLSTIDVSSYAGGNAKVEFYAGANGLEANRYESGDYFLIEYAFDSDISTGANTVGNVPALADLETGTYAIGGAFYGGVGAASSDLLQDTDLDGAGNSDGTKLTQAMQEISITYTIPAGANNMSVRVNVLGGSAEEYVVDYIRISAESGGASVPTSATIAASVFLEGAYNGTNLNTTINSSIPSAQPYSGATYNNHAGTENASAPATAVDWVLVELREAGSAAAAANSTKVGSAAGFLMSDGTIKATDGTSDLTVSLSGNTGADFYVVVYHRNHLPIMSANAISESSGTYSIDFTSNSANTYQTTTALASLSGSKFGMPSGDIDQDGDVDATDLSTWRTNNGGTFSYSGSGASDLNLDGVVNAVDRNDFHQKNTSKSRQVPN